MARVNFFLRSGDRSALLPSTRVVEERLPTATVVFEQLCRVQGTIAGRISVDRSLDLFARRMEDGSVAAAAYSGKRR